MLINLSELLTREDSELKKQVPLEMTYCGSKPGEFPISKAAPVSFVLTNTGDKKVCISGSVDLTVIVPCDRCLTDVPLDFSLSFEREVDFGIEEEERVKQLEETNYLTGYDLDVDQLVRNELLVNWPMKVLCSEDCRGICIRCGTNLNNGACDCDNTELDPRMAVIRDVFNQAMKPQNGDQNKEV